MNKFSTHLLTYKTAVQLVSSYHAEDDMIKYFIDSYFLTFRFEAGSKDRSVFIIHDIHYVRYLKIFE